MISVIVNGNTVRVNEGSTLYEAIKVSGSYVPVLCYHPRLPAKATCRICLVNVNGNSKPVPSCANIARDGDIIVTDSTELNAYRRLDTQFLLSRHPNECMKCEVSGDCKLQNLVKSEQIEEIWPKSERGDKENHPEHSLRDHTSPSIYKDLDKCIDCGLCVQACGPALQDQNIIGFGERGEGMIPITIFDKPLADTKCISCGQCTAVCPVGALIERPDWHAVKRVLDSKRRRTIVQVAPATRVAIGEEFGMQPGAVNTGRLVNALRLLGFDFVFDTNFAADLTIMEEGSELLMRVDRHVAALEAQRQIDSMDASMINTDFTEAHEAIRAANDKPLPQFTSCCPGWINWIEINRPDLLQYLSTTKSPQMMLGAVAKRGIFPKSKLMNEPRIMGGNDSTSGQVTANFSDFEERPYAVGKEEAYVVSIMPCTAKKDEAARPGMRGDVDAVLTTRELARLIRARKIPFASLSNEGEFDNPLGESSGAGMIFGASGGVMEAALRTATHILAERNKVSNHEGENEAQIVDVKAMSDAPLEFHSLRGTIPGVKVAKVPGVGDVAVCNGIRSAQDLLKTDDWKSKYIAIEVMSCVGGCLGGGGEPKSDDPDVLKKRMQSIYSIDKGQARRKSHENEQVKQLYNELLDHPLSHTSEKLLHTTFSGRYSDRELLGRFLEAVDQRDGKAAAKLFTDDGEWCTNTPVFGSVLGHEAIRETINSKLPAKKLGPLMFRHRLEDPTSGFVVNVGNEQVRFDMVSTGTGAQKKISKLTRVPLTPLMK